MDEILNAIFSKLDDNTLGTITQRTQTSPTQAKSALQEAIPILVNALARNSQTNEGAAALQNALQKDHDGSLLEDLGSFFNNPEIANGAGILKHVLGEKRQNVEQYISKDTGVDKSAAGKILEMAAPIVMGYLGKKLTGNLGSGASGGNVIGDILGSVLQSGTGQTKKSQGMINQILDRDNDGSVADDIANMGMSFLGKLLKKRR